MMITSFVPPASLGEDNKSKGNCPCLFPVFFYLSVSGSPSTITFLQGENRITGNMKCLFLLPLLTKEEVGGGFVVVFVFCFLIFVFSLDTLDILVSF